MTSAGTALRIGAGLLLAGLLLASPALLVPGAALALIAVAIPAWIHLSARGASVCRSELPARVVEGEPFELGLRGTAGLVPMLGELVDPALGAPLRLRSLRPGSRFELLLQGRMPRRGRHLLSPPSLHLSDPLGIFERRIAGGAAESILVLPRVEPLRGPADSEGGPAVGRLSSGAGELTAAGLRDSAADPEVDGLRPYRPGTRASRIFWPALARGGELVERNLAPAADSGPLVVLDPSGAPDPEALDRAVRAAASLTVHLAQLGGCELLLPGARNHHSIGPEPGSWLEAHAALALVGVDDGAPRPPQRGTGTALVWISAAGDRRPATPLRRGYLIAPHPLPGRRLEFTVAGCHGYLLASGRRARPAESAAA